MGASVARHDRTGSVSRRSAVVDGDAVLTSTPFDVWHKSRAFRARVPPSIAGRVATPVAVLVAMLVANR